MREWGPAELAILKSSCMHFSKGETDDSRYLLMYPLCCSSAYTVCMTSGHQASRHSRLKVSFCFCRRGLSTISEHNTKSRSRLQTRLSEKAVDVLQDSSRESTSTGQPRSTGVTADGSLPSAPSLHSSSSGIIRGGASRRALKQQQTVGLQERPKAPEPLPVVQHKHTLASATYATTTYTTTPYRRAHQAPRMPGGRTSPTPFSAHLSGQIPGRVLPLLNEVSTGYRPSSHFCDDWRKLCHQLCSIS